MKTIRLLTNATYTSDQCLSTLKVWTNHLGESSESAHSDSVALGWGRGATFPTSSQVKPMLLIGKNLTLLNSITLYNYPTKRGLHRLSISILKKPLPLWLSAVTVPALYPALAMPGHNESILWSWRVHSTLLQEDLEIVSPPLLAF